MSNKDYNAKMSNLYQTYITFRKEAIKVVNADFNHLMQDDNLLEGF